VRLAEETAESLKLGEFDDLPPDLRKKVKAQADLLADSQVAELERKVKFQFTNSVDSTDSDDLLTKDLIQSAEGLWSGGAIDAAAGNVTAHVVNSARELFFFDPRVVTEIASFSFVNPDPVSPICQDLAGSTFSVDDPESARFFPPLHHNCKSYLVPNLRGSSSEDKEITGLKPSKADLEKYITLSVEGPG